MNSLFTAFSILNNWATCISNRTPRANITYQGRLTDFTPLIPWNFAICQPVSADPNASPASKNESSEKTTFMNMIRMVEYPTLKFSRMAAGMISTSAIQLQFLLNQSLSSVKFRISTSAMDNKPQGNKRNVDG